MSIESVIVSKAMYQADRQKYMAMAKGERQVIVQDENGEAILILGRGKLPPVREDWPTPLYVEDAKRYRWLMKHQGHDLDQNRVWIDEQMAYEEARNSE